MHLVNSTTEWFKRIIASTFSLLLLFNSMAQDNSPYSRYGVGDLVPGQNIINRGMGSVSAGFGQGLNLNLTNPAALGNIYTTTFELGGEWDIKSIKSTVTPDKFKTNNAVISYLQIGFPITSKKMMKRGDIWGVSFGLKPISKVNYKVQVNKRIPGVDSTFTLYEGKGGLNQVNFSTGFKKTSKGVFKNEFSIGLSTGYTFGTKDFSTKRSFLNDSVSYYRSNNEVISRYGGAFLHTGVQYLLHLYPNSKNGFIRFGAYANFEQKLNAYQSTINETFGYDGNGTPIPIDSVYRTSDVKGQVQLPGTYGAGAMYQTKNGQWLLGADFEFTNWSTFRNYNNEESLQNNWVIRAGAEYSPVKENPTKLRYWNSVKYRAGFFYGPDYVKLGDNRNLYAITAGASFPLTSSRILGRGEFVVLNTAIEAGGRGNKQSLGVRENFVRINFGISMNARWFQKRIYD